MSSSGLEATEEELQDAFANDEDNAMEPENI